MSNQDKQIFGNSWTKEKLDLIDKYLNAYTIALKNMPFKKIYIDAFAGTGEIETNGGEFLSGSTKRALSTTVPFDHYYFIEYSSSKCQVLRQMVKNEFPQLEDRVTILCGDANEKLDVIIKGIDWVKNRALLFLDPFATQVQWETLEKVARTKAIDMWYLYPFSALNRLLKNEGDTIDETWERCIDKMLGTTDWKDALYEKDKQISIFDIEGQDRLVKNVNTESLKQYIIKRLKTIFIEVSDNSKLLKNDKQSSLFLLIFAVSNPGKKARNLAMKIANTILNTNDNRG